MSGADNSCQRERTGKDAPCKRSTINNLHANKPLSSYNFPNVPRTCNCSVIQQEEIRIVQNSVTILTRNLGSMTPEGTERE